MYTKPYQIFSSSPPDQNIGYFLPNWHEQPSKARCLGFEKKNTRMHLVEFEKPVHVAIQINNGLLCQIRITNILGYNKIFHTIIIKTFVVWCTHHINWSIECFWTRSTLETLSLRKDQMIFTYASALKMVKHYKIYQVRYESNIYTQEQKPNVTACRQWCNDSYLPHLHFQKRPFICYNSS